MPTNIAILGRERTIATLARRLYGLGTGVDAALQRRAERALLAANPRLATAAGFTSGDRIVVPAAPGLTPAAEVEAADATPGGVSGEAALRLQGLASRMADAFGEAAANRQKTQSLIADTQFVRAATAALPQARDVLAKTKDRLAKEEQEQAALSARLKTAGAAAQEGLAALEALARKTRG